MWAFVAMLANIRWVRLVAMFVGIAGLWRLVQRPATGTAAVAPVTTAKPGIRSAEPPRPRPPYDDWGQGMHLPKPDLDERPKAQLPHKKAAKHAKHSPLENETIEGGFVSGRRRHSS
jgi:hypothetical protein